jgi:hypothetical protein
MTFPMGVAAGLARGLVEGPVMKLLEAHIADQELRRKLAAELEKQAVNYFTRGAELGAGVVMAEVQSEHWLSRSWRPLLMLLLMGFLVLAGFVLPLADAIAGRTLPFAPRWQALPQGFWDFLAVGMGGYIGGRSLEKVAGAVASMKATDGRTAGLPFMRRSDRMD